MKPKISQFICSFAAALLALAAPFAASAATGTYTITQDGATLESGTWPSSGAGWYQVLETVRGLSPAVTPSRTHEILVTISIDEFVPTVEAPDAHMWYGPDIFPSSHPTDEHFKFVVFKFDGVHINGGWGFQSGSPKEGMRMEFDGCTFSGNFLYGITGSGDQRSLDFKFVNCQNIFATTAGNSFGDLLIDNCTIGGEININSSDSCNSYKEPSSVLIKNSRLLYASEGWCLHIYLAKFPSVVVENLKDAAGNELACYWGQATTYLPQDPTAEKVWLNDGEPSSSITQDSSLYSAGKRSFHGFTPWRINYDKNADDATGTTYQDEPTPLNGSAIVLSCGFTKPGFQFVSWNTKADGSGDTYEVGASIPVTKNDGSIQQVTLYAQWGGNYTISGKNYPNGVPGAQKTVQTEGGVTTVTYPWYSNEHWMDNVHQMIMNDWINCGTRENVLTVTLPQGITITDGDLCLDSAGFYIINPNGSKGLTYPIHDVHFVLNQVSFSSENVKFSFGPTDPAGGVSIEINGGRQDGAMINGCNTGGDYRNVDLVMNGVTINSPKGWVQYLLGDVIYTNCTFDIPRKEYLETGHVDWQGTIIHPPMDSRGDRAEALFADNTWPDVSPGMTLVVLSQFDTAEYGKCYVKNVSGEKVLLLVDTWLQDAAKYTKVADLENGVDHATYACEQGHWGFTVSVHPRTVMFKRGDTVVATTYAVNGLSQLWSKKGDYDEGNKTTAPAPSAADKAWVLESGGVVGTKYDPTAPITADLVYVEGAAGPTPIPVPVGQTLTYNGAAQCGVAANDAYTRTGDTAVLLPGGPYSVTLSLKDKENTEWATGGTDDKTVEWSMNKAALSVKADAKSRPYGAPNPELTYTTSGLQGSDTAAAMLSGALSCDATLASHVGEQFDIKQGTLALTTGGAARYTLSYTGAKLTITKVMLTVTPDEGQSFVYGNPIAPTYSVTGGSANLLEGTLALSGYDVGPQTIEQGTLGLTSAAAGNYDLHFISGKTAEVTPRPATVTARDVKINVGEPIPASYDADVTGLVDGDSPPAYLISCSATSSAAPGSYTIIVTGEKSQGNYTVSFVNGTLTISGSVVYKIDVADGAKDIPIKVDTDWITEKDPSIDVKNEAAVRTFLETTKTDGNGFKVWQSYLLGLDFNLGLLVTGRGMSNSTASDSINLELVDAAGQSLTMPDKTGVKVQWIMEYADNRALVNSTKTAPQDSPAFTIPTAFTETSFLYYRGHAVFSVDSDNPAASIIATISTPTAEAITYDGETHTIIELTNVDPADATKAYRMKAGEAEFSEWSDVVPTAKNVGFYMAEAKAERLGYQTKEAARSLRINAASVTVKADDKAKVVGGDDPELTATVTGLFGADTVKYTLERAAGEVVGEYAITPSGSDVQGNYNVSFVPGVFTITGTAVAKPTAVTGLKYNGSEQTGVPAATGYTVANGKATNAGNYTATATLDAGHYWADDKSTAPYNVDWSIAKADVDMTGVSFTGKTVEFTGAEQTIEISGTLPSGVSVAYANNRLTNVGSTTATATFSLADAMTPNYNVPAAKTATLTITKVQNAWTTQPSIEPSSWKVSETPGAVTWGTANFGTVGKWTINGDEYTSQSAVETFIANAGEGTYSVAVNVTGTDNYTGLVKNFQFTVTPMSISIPVTINGGYYYELGSGDDIETVFVFTSTTAANQTFQVGQACEADLLVVGGGGGGGGGGSVTYAGCGGGGGGEVKAVNVAQLNANTQYAITVGAGGAGGNNGNNGNDGGTSSFGSLASANGGKGGVGGAPGGKDGGQSGNGKSGGKGVTRSRTPWNGAYAGGGGGGADGEGKAGNDTGSPGRGGEGVANSIIGTPQVYGSGGGGGINWGSDSPGISIYGKGGTNAGHGSFGNDKGNVGWNPNGVPGFGGGGGGGAIDNTVKTFANGGAGGSGTVIIRVKGKCEVASTKATYYLVDTDAQGKSSFKNNGDGSGWTPDGGATTTHEVSAERDYVIDSNHSVRTPKDSGNTAFAGDLLTLDDGSVMLKYESGATNQTVTIPNLIVKSGSVGNFAVASTGKSFTTKGNVVIPGNSALVLKVIADNYSNSRVLNVESVLSGTGAILVDPYMTMDVYTGCKSEVNILGAANGFAGILKLAEGSASALADTITIKIDAPFNGTVSGMSALTGQGRNLVIGKNAMKAEGSGLDGIVKIAAENETYGIDAARIKFADNVNELAAGWYFVLSYPKDSPHPDVSAFTGLTTDTNLLRWEDVDDRSVLCYFPSASGYVPLDGLTNSRQSNSKGSVVELNEIIPNSSTRITAEVNCTAESYNQTLFCARSDDSAQNYTLFAIYSAVNSGWRFDSGNKQSAEKTSSPAGRHTISVTASGATISTEGGEPDILTVAEPLSGNAGGFLRLFYSSRTVNPVDNIANGWTIYSFKIYDGDTLTHNLVPCEVADADKTGLSQGTKGLYDMGGKKFYQLITK